MLIENPEGFKSWLTSVLEPLCEADPEALAKYIYALVKKDRPVDMLRESMVEQLDVFLQNETKPFVELLFKTLETQEYLLPTAIPNANPPNPNVPPVVKSEPPAEISLSKEVKAIIPVSSLPDLTADVNGTSAAAAAAKKDKEPEPPTTTTATHRKDRDREHKKTDLDKEEKGGRATRPRHRSSSRNRSRSRSWERSRRSRSRERSRERERRERSRPWRNKSPPRRYERRRSRSNSPIVPRRSRSPRHNYRGRYRNRSPPRSLSRSRSRSLEKHSDKDKVRDPKDSNKEPLSGAGTPTQDSNHGDTDMRLTSSTQSIQSVVAANTAEGPVAPPQGATTVAGVFPSKRRCRDFDEKGYCMRGELCPYDHGVDPVVLEDTALSSVLTFGPNGQPPIDGAPGPGMLPPPMIRPSHIMHPHHMPPRQMHPMPPEYNPSAPSMWNPRARFGGAPMALPGAPPRGGGMFHAPLLQPAVGHIAGGPGHNHVQRELISVPVHDNTSDNNFPRRNDYPVENQDTNNQLKKKTGFDFSRVGPRTKNPVNCSLELKKVPRGLNNITHLNNHFSKFGKIVNIQVSYEGDPEAALITFSSHAEANAAYRSTEAVLNNRFIKVFWHNNNEGKQENVPPQRSIKDRLGQQVGPTASISGGNKVLNLVQPKATNSTGTPATIDSRNDKVANSSNSFNKLYIPNAKPASQESKAQANSVLQKKQEIIAVKKRQEEARKDMAKMNQDLVKRTHKLLEEQIAHQKQLIEKLEKGNVQGQKKEELKEAIQKLQQSIEDIRKSIMASVKQKAANQIVHAAKITQARKSKEEAQKELLDAELDLITKQQEGADTSALQKRVSELKAKVFLGNTPKITRGSLALRLPRGNKYLKIQRRPFTHQTIDHRPTKLLVSGYESEEKTDVVAHFAKFGEILDYISDDSTPSVILNFKTRKEAEMAVLKGKHFQDRTLSVTWCTSSQMNSQMSSNRNTARTVLLNDSDEDRLLEPTITEEEDGGGGAGDLTADLNEEALLQDDEEEEEENEEDRSWRR